MMISFVLLLFAVTEDGRLANNYFCLRHGQSLANVAGVRGRGDSQHGFLLHQARSGKDSLARVILLVQYFF